MLIFLSTSGGPEKTTVPADAADVCRSFAFFRSDLLLLRGEPLIVRKKFQNYFRRPFRCEAARTFPAQTPFSNFEIRGTALIELVSFHECDSGRVVFSAQHERVEARFEITDDGGFVIVDGCEAARLNLGAPVLLPVIIRSDRRPVTVVQFDDGIGEAPRDRD